MLLRLLLLLQLLAFHYVSCQQELVIGVEDPDLNSALASIISSSSEISRQLPDSIGLRLRFVRIQLPTGTSTVLEAVRNVVHQLNSTRCRALIGNYHPVLAIATKSLSPEIPYLVSKLSNDYDLGDNRADEINLQRRDNLFHCDVDYRHLAMVAKDVAASYSIDRFHIIYDDNFSNRQFLHEFSGSRSLTLCSVGNASSNSASIITDLFTIFTSVPADQLSANHGWILLFSDSNLPLIASSLNQAARAGILTSQMTILLPSFNLMEPQLIDFYKTKATLLTFNWPLSNLVPRNEVALLSAIQCVNHLSLAFKEQLRTAANLVTLITEAQSSKISFSPVTHSRNNVQLIALRNSNSAVLNSSSSLFTEAGVWQQGDSPAFKPVFFDDSTIRQSIIRFGGIETEPYLYRNLKGQWVGLSYDIIQSLSKQLGFRFEIVLAPDNLYGAKLSNGNWTGIMRLFQNDLADISLNLMDPYSERLEICDRSIDLFEDGIQMLSFKLVHAPDFLHTFYPFSFYVWLSIIVTIVLLSLTLFITDKISPNTRGKPMFSIFSSFFLVFSSFLMSKVETEPRKLSSRLFTLLLWFSTLMYVTTYLSNLVAFMVKPIDTVRFSTLSELQHQTSFKWAFLRDSSIVFTIKERWPELFERAEREWPSQMYFESYPQAYDLVQSNNEIIAIEGADSLNFLKNVDCQLRLIGSTEANYYLTLLSRKGFRFKKQIDDALKRMKRDSLATMRSKYFDLNRCAAGKVDIENKNKLGFNYLRGQFLILGIGCALGILLIFLHRFKLRCQQSLDRKSERQLKKGHSYTAEVLRKTAGGYWIRVEGRDEIHFLANSCDFSSGDSQMENSEAGDQILVKYFDKDMSGSKIFIHVDATSSKDEVDKPNQNFSNQIGADFVDSSASPTALAMANSERRNTVFRVQIQESDKNDDSHV